MDETLSYVIDAVRADIATNGPRVLTNSSLVIILNSALIHRERDENQIDNETEQW